MSEPGGGADPYARWDAEDDSVFYSVDRLVTHIEAGAIESLRGWYGRRLLAGSKVLDLMSSWRSHLPDGLGEVVGLGMNANEMADNPQLHRFVVHNLNRTPRLPFDDESFDSVVCAVSVQYLVRPVEVFEDVRRVLRPGGLFAVSFSNRCFPTKAVAVWLTSGDRAHRQIVTAYFGSSGFVDITDEQVPTPDDPLFVVAGRRPA